MNFQVKSKSELPPDPKDKYAAVVDAFNRLSGDDVLFVQPDAKPDGTPIGAYSVGQLVSAVKKRLGEQAEYRRDAVQGGVWLIPTKPTKPRPAGGSAASSPLDRQRCKRCGGTMMRDRLADGEEYDCLMCGNVEYGDAHVPRSRADDPQRRQASYGKTKLG